jgi:hypothetical protein
MDQFFDHKSDPTTEEPERTRYGPKVFEMVKDMNFEFKKKKKEDAEPKPRKKRKRANAEEEEREPVPAAAPVPIFKKKSIFFRYLEY